jgi:hypothetical protein
MTEPTQPFLADAMEPDVTLNGFTLADLAPFTREGSFAATDSQDFRVFYVGRDDVHGVLKYLLARCSRSLAMSMFGLDDDELSATIVHLVESEHVFVQGNLDKSQAGGVHEKKIIAAWQQAVRADFAIGTTASGQIEHTKGGVIDGLVAFEGSTNWSSSGEGTGIGLHGDPNVAGYKAQANTLSVYTNPIQIAKFTTVLAEEHASLVAREAHEP